MRYRVKRSRFEIGVVRGRGSSRSGEEWDGSEPQIELIPIDKVNQVSETDLSDLP